MAERSRSQDSAHGMRPRTLHPNAPSLRPARHALGFAPPPGLAGGPIAGATSGAPAPTATVAAGSTSSSSDPISASLQMPAPRPPVRGRSPGPGPVSFGAPPGLPAASPSPGPREPPNLRVRTSDNADLNYLSASVSSLTAALRALQAGSLAGVSTAAPAAAAASSSAAPPSVAASSAAAPPSAPTASVPAQFHEPQKGQQLLASYSTQDAG